MAKKCDLCGRGSTKGASRSHSKIKTLRRQNINLQTKTVGSLKLKVCASCLRTADKPAKAIAPRKLANKAKAAEAKQATKAAKKPAKKTAKKKTKK